MKENVLDVLMYLFQNYLNETTQVHPDRDSVQAELLEAGFLASEISQAFEWLDGLADRIEKPTQDPRASAFRIYSPQEKLKLSTECQGYVLFLEQVGILDAVTRELVIDRIMALSTSEIDLTDLKWVVLMVLFSHPDHEEAYACMEDLLFDDDHTDYLH